MKKIKRIMAMLLAMVMVLGMTVTASAAASAGDDNKMGTEDDKASVTIQGLKSGDVVTLYKIVKAKYESNDKAFSGYEVVDNFKDVLSLPDLPDDSKKIEFTADQIAAAAAIVDGGNIEVAETIEAASTEVTITDLAPGSYLVKVTAKDSTIYNPAVVSLHYTTDSIAEGTLNLDDKKAWVKKQDAPTLDKWILEGTEYKKGNSVDTGDTVTYVIEATIPSYTGNYPVYEIVDKLENLTYVRTDKVEVIKGKTLVATLEGKAFTTKDNKNLSMNFVTDGEYELQQYQGDTLRIVYTATLDNNETANMFNGSNDNTAYLKYTNDASAEKNPVRTEDAVTHTYTFEITDFVKKTDMDGNALDGAEFTLYTDESCAEDKVYRNDNFTGTVTSAGGGKLVIKGLDAGTYYLKETKAREGYALNNTVFKVEIIEETYEEDGTLGTCTVEIQDNAISANNPYSIKNTKLSSLPSTGGIGTTIFTIGGCAIMIAAAGLFFASRRKANK